MPSQSQQAAGLPNASLFVYGYAILHKRFHISQPVRQALCDKKMNQITEYIEKLSSLIPEFKEYWESDDACFNFGDDSTIHGVFSDFSHLVSDGLQNNNLVNAKDIFIYIESVVSKGGDPANAACTCFLENILNRTPDTINPNTFVPYLGVHSKEFCKGWDKFTGVKTNGL